MFDWTSLLDEAALTEVLPGEYARFARPVCEGLAVFLSGLSETEQAEILTRQASLPVTAGISERLALLAHSCPVLHKLGQTLARDQRLAPELRHHLSGLESLSPTVPLETIEDTLAKELGPLDRRGIRLAPPAIAEASVAVVIPFVNSEEHNGDGRWGGVFKLLKPGIEERLELELNLLGRVGSHLDQRCAALGIPHLDYEESFEQIRDKLSHEVRLDQEQLHMAQAAICFADEPRVHIPALLDHCTPRVTAMERISGGKVTDRPSGSPSEPSEIAKLMVRELVARPIFSRASGAMFHGDPHAGNLFLTDENRLGILDWSLVGQLSQPARVAIVQIILGAVTLDAGRIVAVLENLSERQKIDQSALLAVVHSSLKQIRQGQLPGLTWLLDLLDGAVQTARLRVAGDLMLLRKSLHVLDGVLATMCAGQFQMDGVLLAEFFKHFALEWPRRWFTLPSSREFATHLSSFDLARTLWSYPATAVRFWSGKGIDLLDACSASGNLRD